ncbi:3-phosphonopyruvate decarboxylase [Cohnella kolymensis]|uniref:3-phosphonopyruvate decarboxylase n=1 Tax=Cohnella kolymensis TaxID=1590652 RepID=A0ABR5A7J9_9BACL|nr:3-phosphonopyruvate decarboxylase [Cohnella kolymensis]
MNTRRFGKELQRIGFAFYSGVPCSYLNSLINYAINEGEYVAAANEGDGIAIASGALLGGKKPVVLMQNSGLANAVSPLVSLNYPFRIPILGFVSLRGEPGISDEPQHELMGRITEKLLDLMQVKWIYLSSDLKTAKRQLLLAAKYVDRNQPFFFVVRKGTFEQEPLKEQEFSLRANRQKAVKQTIDELPTRHQALKVIDSWKDSKTVLLATTGKTGRQLYEIKDAPGNLYMVGSMGCVGSLGLGLALTKQSFDIVSIDGDGSILMRMGSLATNGYYSPSNMIHILLDNNAHDSTGGQRTVSHNVNFVEVASACGYAKSIYVHNLNELHARLKEWKAAKELTFLYMRISSSSEEQLGRPAMKPYEVKERLQFYLNGGSPQAIGEGEES